MLELGKSAAELGDKALKDRGKGCPVHLKIVPSTLKTKTEFVCRKQRWAWWACEDIILIGGKVYGDYLLAALLNYDEKNGASCKKTNLERLVWLTRTRLYS